MRVATWDDIAIRSSVGMRSACLGAVILVAACGAGDPTDLHDGGSVAITTTTLPDADLGFAYTGTLEASGGTAPYAWFRPNGELPAGVAIDQAAGLVVGTPTRAGDFAFVVIVTDATGAMDTAQVSLRVVGPAPLVITSFNLPVIMVDVPFSTRFQATGGDGGPYFWHATGLTPGFPNGLPSGLTLDIDGNLTGVPTYPAGTYQFVLEVATTGIRGLTATLPVDLELRAPSNLRVETTGLPDIHQGEPYSATILASGGAAPYSFSTFQGPPPDGVALAPDGEVSGVATRNSARPDTVGVLVTDAVGATAFAILPFTYVPAPVSIPDLQLPVGTIGLTYEVFLAHEGPSVNETWTVTGGALPDGIVVRLVPLQHGGAHELFGVPTEIGTFEFDLTLTSNGETASRHFAMTINPKPILIATTALPNASVATSYQVFLVAQGGTAPYVWTLASGSLPPGLTLSAAGELSGPPTASGTFTFTVRADDSSPDGFQQTDTASLSLTVNP